MFVKKLSEIADIKTGGTPSRSRPEYWGGEIPWIKISNINAKHVTKFDETITKLGLENSSAKIFEKGTILYTIFATLGRVGILTFDAATNQAIAGIKLIDDHISIDYLYYYLRSAEDSVKAIGNGAAQQNINLGILKNFLIPVPPLEKQNNIVNSLETIGKGISQKKNQLSILDELIKSRFIEMFGDPDANPFDWEIVTINDVCSSIVRGPFGSALKKEFFVPKSETTIKVYEQQHAIKKNDKLGTYYVTKEKYQSLKRFTCHEGDILMSCSGTMGELYQLPIGCEQGIINQALCKFTLNQKMLPIVFLESMKHVVDQIDKKGSGIQNIAAVSYVKSMKICLPPIQIQKKFVSFYEQIDKSKFVVHSKYFLWEFLTLFSSTMAYSSVVSILA